MSKLLKFRAGLVWCIAISALVRDAYGTVFIHDAAGNLVEVRPSSLPASATAGPRTQLAQPGDSVSFSVLAAGSGPLTYQWRRGGTSLPQANGSTLHLSNVTPGDFGIYTAAVTHSGGTIDANPVELILDADDDELGDTRETSYFGNTSAQSGDGDADTDGVMNANEFADGTDPANPASRHYVLTVMGTKGGVITVQPVQERYAPGSAVTLTAYPDAGVQLLDWSGDASGSTSPLALTMDQDRNVTAIFGVPLAEALDGPGFSWSTSGAGVWRGLLGGTHDGVDAALAPTLAVGQQSQLETMVTGQGKLSFWARLYRSGLWRRQ